MSEAYEQEIPYDQPAVWIVLEGAGTISMAGNQDDLSTTPFERGQTLLIPAGLNNARVALQKDTAWLEITFPQALTEQIA